MSSTSFVKVWQMKMYRVAVIWDTTNEHVELIITEMLGEIIYKQQVAVANSIIEESISLSNSIANGMYLLALRKSDGNYVFHIVVEK